MKINIVFYLLVMIAIVFLWFALAFMFKPIGKFLFRLWDDAKTEMKEEKLEKENLENKENKDYE